MTNPLDELKELEARRAAAFIGDHFKSPQRLFDESHGTIYRRLALEVAKELSEKEATFEKMSQITVDVLFEKQPIIFSPSDPRLVIGNEYEFSDWWDFSDGPGVSELIAVHETSEPFIHGESGWPYTFIRELPKEERGES